MVVVGWTISVAVIALVPVQPPVATQIVSPLVIQSSVLVSPAIMLLGVAVNVIVGGGEAEKVTVTESAPVPPSPVQART